MKILYNYFDLSLHEQRALWLLANRCKEIISKKHQLEGINVGIKANKKQVTAVHRMVHRVVV